jgi:hypothetical protein
MMGLRPRLGEGIPKARTGVHGHFNLFIVVPMLLQNPHVFLVYTHSSTRFPPRKCHSFGRGFVSGGGGGGAVDSGRRRADCLL